MSAPDSAAETTIAPELAATVEPALTSGEVSVVAYGDVELRFHTPIAYKVLPGREEGTFVAALAEPALALKLRDRLNHGRGATPAGARKSLERRLLRLALSDSCPALLASLVESVGPREHVSRTPVTDMLRLAALAQWLCIDERRCRAYSEVTLRQEPCWAPETAAPCYRLDLVFLERAADGRPPRATGIELKSSRADFSSDRKWPGYIGRVDRLYIAAPPGVVKDGELPEQVGLLELHREPGDCFFEVRSCGGDAEVSELARYDLMYALACTDRFTGGGLELRQRALHAVDAYWESRPRRRKT